jgi:hypothetical protein
MTPNRQNGPFPQVSKYAAHDYLVVFASGRDEFKNGKVHTDFKLNQTEQKDYVILSKPDKSIVDKIKLPITQVEQSVCRSDGWRRSDWVYSRIATPDANNQSTARLSVQSAYSFQATGHSDFRQLRKYGRRSVIKQLSGQC